MKRFITVAIVVGAFVGVFYLIGLIAPRTQSTGARIDFTVNPSRVYPLIADVDSWDRWYPEITRTDERPEKGGHPVWALTNKEGKTVELEVTVATEPGAWSGTYEDEGLKYTLRFDIKWFGEGSMVLITEQRDARSPWVRARRSLGSRQESVNAALTALGRQLGESAVVKKR